MDELKAILDALAVIDAEDLEDRSATLERMPQDVNDSNYYSGMVVYPLLKKMRDQCMNLSEISAYLDRMYEGGHYRLVHLYLAMCYVSVGIEQPPYFLNFVWDETLLKVMLAEILADIREFVADLEYSEKEEQ